MTPNLFGIMDEVVLVCCTILVVLCFFGLRSNLFRDNWLQTIGMSMALVGAMVVGWYAGFTHRSSWRIALLVVGFTLFACGTAWKTWTYRHTPHDAKPPAPPTPPNQSEDNHHAIGAKF